MTCKNDDHLHSINKVEDISAPVQIETPEELLKEELKLAGELKSFYNVYATKKTISNGLLDGALLATNAVQMKTLLTIPSLRGPLWVVSLILVSISIISQTVMAVILGILGNSNLADDSKQRINVILNDVVLALTALVFVINILTNVFVQVNVNDLVNNSSKWF